MNDEPRVNRNAMTSHSRSWTQKAERDAIVHALSGITPNEAVFQYPNYHASYYMSRTAATKLWSTK